MSLFSLFEDVVTIVAAPIQVAATVVEAVVKPVAEGAEEVVKTVKDIVS